MLMLWVCLECHIIADRKKTLKYVFQPSPQLPLPSHLKPDLHINIIAVIYPSSSTNHSPHTQSPSLTNFLSVNLLKLLHCKLGAGNAQLHIESLSQGKVLVAWVSRFESGLRTDRT